MLTKKERAAIAERTRPFNGNSLCYSDIYRCLFGVEVPCDTTFEEDSKAMVTRILDLCDTSNMVELPVDKDGEVIHVGDVVYDERGKEWQVSNIRLPDEGRSILLRSDDSFSWQCPNKLIHKKPVTIKSLVKKLTDIVAADYGTPMVVKRKLSDIADQLESLGDNNE